MSTIKLRIVVAEDEGVIAMLLCEVLEQLGHEVVAVSATQAACIEAAERFDPDLMIVDDGLRSGTGVAAMDAILLDRFIPHVFVSGDPATVRSLTHDAVIIEKPYDALELVEAMERALAAEKSRSTASADRSASMEI